MKTTRKSANNSVVSSKANEGFNSATTAAAVSVMKFGQATFTSVRRQDCENGNGNFVPLKKTKLDDDLKNEKPQVVPAAKPKVYKFFKSRASNQQTETVVNKNSSTSNAPPKSLVLNNFSKIDGVKRITTASNKSYQSATYSKIKNTSHSNIISKTVSLSDNKSCEIKVCGDKTIKKVISPTKTTEFIIRNNSNVRNATLKSISTPTQILSTNRGIRASRRLKGIEPEAHSIRKGTTIHVDYEKDGPSCNKNKSDGGGDDDDDDDIEMTPIGDDSISSENGSNDKAEKYTLSTTIEVSNDNDDDALENEIGECSNNIEPIKSDFDIEEDNKIEEVSQSNSSCDNEIQPKDSNEVNDSFPEPTSALNNNETVDYKVDESNAINEINVENIADSQPDEEKKPAAEDVKKETVCSIKPKKKIFSNRDRSKAKFNTKSFFSSNTKDEFDIELDDNTNSSSQPANTDKASQDKDGDDDPYLKLKRVKKAYQCHDLGETEQFDEDIKYYLSGIVSSNPISMRCLSILGLSQQAMRPEFRMHLRAHDDMPRIIKALMDAPQDSSLALCTATLMFVYNQDRLTMDIDPNALSLMLELLETRLDECNQVEQKHRTKVVSLVEEMKNTGLAEYLKLNEITAGKLAMETLLGLTSKRAGGWFKDELRRLKGIDYIVNTVLRCAEDYLEEGHMVKIDRCMHVLENVTFDHVENQSYITKYNESKFISTCITLLKNCKQKIIASNDSKVFLTAFFSILRVLTNLTSESVSGCEVVGTFDGIIELLLESLFELPSFIMPDQRFDMMVIILCLCINLSEFCQDIRDIIIKSEDYVSKLTELLFRKIEEADQVEQQTDHLLESHKTVQMTEAMQDNLLMQMISKSGTHMEHSLVSACVCLLFGCCVQDNEDYMNILKESLPKNSLGPLIGELEKLRDFSHLADIMTQKGKNRVQRVLQRFKLYK